MIPRCAVVVGWIAVLMLFGLPIHGETLYALVFGIFIGTVYPWKGQPV